MSKAADLRAEFLEHWEAVLCAVPEHYTEEFRRSVEALLEATRKEAFEPSPLTIWLLQDPGNRFAMAEAVDRRIKVQLQDVTAPGDEPVAEGHGETLEEACADSLNDAMREAELMARVTARYVHFTVSGFYRNAGANIRRFRQALDMPQSELARRIGFTKSAICHIEKGRKRINLETALQIANALGVELSELVSLRRKR